MTSGAGSSSENAEKLTKAMKNGVYYFVFHSESTNFNFPLLETLQLQPKPKDKESQSSYFVTYTIDNKEHKVSWEEIEESVMRFTVFSLQEHREVEKFVQTHLICVSLFNQFLKLHKCGHPAYQHSIIAISLAEKDLNELKHYLSLLEKQLERWEKKINQTRRDNECLLFLSSKQTLSAYSAAISNDVQRFRSFLRLIFPHSEFTGEQQKQVQQLLEGNAIPKIPFFFDTRDISETLASAKIDEQCLNAISGLSSLFNLIGKEVFNNSSPLDFILYPSSSPFCYEGVATIFSAIDFTSEEVFKLLMHIYKERKPSAKELFFCSPQTSSQELTQQLELVKYAKHARFSFINVDQLTYKKRQKLFEALLENRQMSINLIFCKYQGLDQFAQFNKVDCVERKKDMLGSEQAVAINTNKILSGDSISVILVTGEPGDGKGHWIKKEMKKRKGKRVYLRVNEKFSPNEIIQLFRQMELSSKETLNVHFNISSFAPLSKLDLFFFQLIFSNTIFDHQSGDVFSFANATQWTFFVEIPCTTIDSRATIEEINEFKSTPLTHLLPSIKYSGEKMELTKDEELEINEEARQVCIFLKAFEDTINERGLRKSISSDFFLSIDFLLRPKESDRSECK